MISIFLTVSPQFMDDQLDRCAQMVHDAVHIRKHMMNGEAGVLDDDSELQFVSSEIG